ncbi:MAG: cation:proton antiporter [Kiritimatiellae bacterium]|nr:cation:proton antiporter [Kiritimatiellia bacterium]
MNESETSSPIRRAFALRRRTIPLLLPLLLLLPMTAAAAEGGGEVAPGLAARMMVLVLQLGAILFAARLGGMLFTRMKMPGVLGELCIGIVIGPSLLGGLAIPWLPGLEHGLFHVPAAIQSGSTPVSPELYGICTLASVVLLFLVGLETDLGLLVRYALAGGLVGLGGVVFSFLVGDLLGVWLLPHIMEGHFTLVHPACIFLGVMSTATSVSITARILSERKKLDSPEGVTILAGAVIDDVLGIIMLAIGIGVVGVAGGTGRIDWSAIGLIAARSFGIWLCATIAGILAARHISAALKFFGDKAEIATLSLGLALIVSGLFEQAELAMIIGAYVMGLALSRTDISQVVREHLQPIFLFMVPVFFVVMGMMVNLPLLCSPKVLLFGLIYTVGAVLAKLIGCGAPALLCHFNLRGALRVGLGMIPRGEVALIVAGIGLSKGLITQDVFGVAILMTLLTTILPPPLLVRAFQHPGTGLRRGAPQPAELPEVKYTFPTPEFAALLLNHLLEGFRKEGFFVHMLNLDEGLYQVRKNVMVIGIACQDRTIEFKCSADEVPFVRTAMTEVVLELEQTLKELRRPLDTGSLLSPSEDELTGTGNKRLLRYLRPDGMVPAISSLTKCDVISELIGVLARQGLVRDEAEALTAVLKREEAMSTGLRHGFACPHARTTAVDQLVCAIGLKPEGMPFDASDGQPTTVIMLVLSPTGQAAPYMEFMASMRSVLTPEGLKSLAACRTAEEMFAAVTRRA